MLRNNPRQAEAVHGSRTIPRIVGATALLFLGAVHADEGSREGWIGAWGFPSMSFATAEAPTTADRHPPPPVTNFNNVTVRQIVRIAPRTSRIRVRLSNEFGTQALKVGAAHIALVAQDGAIVAESDRVLTFSQQHGVVIPAGAPVLSDALDWQLPALSKLAVSIYLPEETVPPAHRVSEYVSAPGDFAGAQSMPGAELVRTGALVSEIEVESTVARRVVVTLGDSITEGFGSTLNEFRGWPDRLAERLQQTSRGRGWSVVDAGINSNRLLHNAPGSGALTRVDRDVLAVPGVAMVIIMEGINDIGYSHTTPSEAVTSDEIIAAYQQLITRAHAHGIAVVGATIMPYEGSHYYDADGEDIRQAVNRWIRTRGSFDAVVDFDAALRDPTHPTQVNPSLERGDHLHPNDAGYAAMAAAIDLKLFSRPLLRHPL